MAGAARAADAKYDQQKQSYQSNNAIHGSSSMFRHNVAPTHLDIRVPAFLDVLSVCAIQLKGRKHSQKSSENPKRTHHALGSFFADPYITCTIDPSVVAKICTSTTRLWFFIEVWSLDSASPSPNSTSIFPSPTEGGQGVRAQSLYLPNANLSASRCGRPAFRIARCTAPMSYSMRYCVSVCESISRIA